MGITIETGEILQSLNHDGDTWDLETFGINETAKSAPETPAPTFMQEFKL